MLTNHPILRLTIFFTLPFLIIYSIYIQINGETSPGGGFQAGVLFATCFIAVYLIYGTENILFKNIEIYNWLVLAVVGLSIYLGVGLLALVFGKNFLNYEIFDYYPNIAQTCGIFLVELGVGLTIFATMLLIFFSFNLPEDKFNQS